EAIDEDFDADGDGAFVVGTCEGGTDCDDTNATIGPDAAETPYDGVDQDCSGADLTDVDGDGYDGGGGFDCDDADATVHPNADDAPKDGIDGDCVGGDDIDGDRDGYGDAALGGDDCDDLDPMVRPGALDWWNDALDADCDGTDGAVAALADAPITILGEEGSQDLVGQDVALCDLDGDALLDLVISAPFGDSYIGRVGVFYGDGAATWGADMRLADADTLVTSGGQFLGFEVGCADLDGDGYDDLVTGRGEIHYSGAYDADFELVVWYGDGGKLPERISERDADARFAMELGAPEGALNVYGRTLTVSDLDGDGASEIVVVNQADAALTLADGAFYVLGGGRYTGSLTLVDEAAARIEGEGISSATPLPDLDGDGVSELLFGEAGWFDPAADDTGAAVYLGRASVVEADALADGEVGALAYGFWQGSGAVELGYVGATGDFDGDGLVDLAVTGFGDTSVATAAGTVYLFAPAEGAVPAAGTTDDATALRGTTESGLFGYQLLNVGDVDADGADDLLASELYGDATFGRVWLVSGAAMIGGGSPETAARMAWTGEHENALTGNALAAGDLDGDGVLDFVVGAYGHMSDGLSQSGKVYVVLSGG
ncbi:MAG: FG-GAP repeat protein, partial [Myxococcota bacterium]